MTDSLADAYRQQDDGSARRAERRRRSLAETVIPSSQHVLDTVKQLEAQGAHIPRSLLMQAGYAQSAINAQEETK